MGGYFRGHTVYERRQKNRWMDKKIIDLKKKNTVAEQLRKLYRTMDDMHAANGQQNIPYDIEDPYTRVMEDPLAHRGLTYLQEGEELLRNNNLNLHQSELRPLQPFRNKYNDSVQYNGINNSGLNGERPNGFNGERQPLAAVGSPFVNPENVDAVAPKEGPSKALAVFLFMAFAIVFLLLGHALIIMAIFVCARRNRFGGNFELRYLPSCGFKCCDRGCLPCFFPKLENSSLNGRTLRRSMREMFADEV
jgi:hypothetical protein